MTILWQTIDKSIDKFKHQKIMELKFDVSIIRLDALVSGLGSKAIATCDKAESFNVVPSRTPPSATQRTAGTFPPTIKMAGLTHREIRYGTASELQTVDVWELPESERIAATASDRYWFM